MRFKRFFLLFCIIFLCFLGFRYRLRQYQSIPPVSTTFDEQGYLWLGKSILNTGIPANWSALDIYQDSSEDNQLVYFQDYNLFYGSQSPSIKNWSNFPHPLYRSIESKIDGYQSQFLIVQPYLDNPPLFGVILAIFDNGTTALRSSVKNIRLFPIVTSIVTITFIFIYCYQQFNFTTAIISSLIFALGPAFVISNRLALPENLIATLLILCLFLNTKSKYHKLARYLTYFICFLCPLIKISALIIPASLILIDFFIKKELNFRLMLVTLLGLFTYIGYGFLLDKNILIQMFVNQGQRQFLGPISMLIKAIYPQIPFPYFDGWIIFAYFSIIIISINKISNKTKPLLIAFITHTIFFLLFGGNNFPWYQWIIYPLLAICCGVVISYSFNKFSQTIIFPFFIIVFSSLNYYARYGIDWGKYLNTFRLLIVVFLIIPFIPSIFKNRSKVFSKLSLFIMFIISLFYSIQIINNFQSIWPILLNKHYPI